MRKMYYVVWNTFQTILKDQLLFHQFLTADNCFVDAVKEQGVKKGIYNPASFFLGLVLVFSFFFFHFTH